MKAMGEMTRTHWLLVVIVGLLVWGFGWVAAVPAAEFVGFVVTVGAGAGLLLGGDTLSKKRTKTTRRSRRR